MAIDSETIIGSIILFVVTTVFLSFVISKINIKSLQNYDNTVNYVKVISMASLISFLFTISIAYISMMVDKENLKNAKKSS